MSLKKYIVSVTACLNLSLALSLPLATAVAVGASVVCVPSAAMAYPDPVIPLMEPLPFPWETIEGIWQARVNGKVMWFSLEVRSDDGGRRFLHVLQLEPSTNSVVAEGNGFIDSKTGTVRAGMVGDGGSFMVFIGLYKNEKVSQYPRLVTMLTSRSLQSLSEEFSVMIEKIVPYPVHNP